MNTSPNPHKESSSTPTLATSFLIFSVLGLTLLTLASWTHIIFGSQNDHGMLVKHIDWSGTFEFLQKLVGVGRNESPAYLRLDRWVETAPLAYETLAMSVLATIIAAGCALISTIPAARTMAWGDTALSNSLLWRMMFFVNRGFFILTRGIPELVWAALLIFFLNPGAVVGALALAIHNYGILGKLSAEVIEDTNQRPIKALRGTGASGIQILTYGILPQVLPQFLLYALYRWEVIIRTTIIVGFVGAGGLGRDFRLHMSWFQYTDVVLILLWYLLLVLAVDLISAWLRNIYFE